MPRGGDDNFSHRRIVFSRFQDWISVSSGNRSQTALAPAKCPVTELQALPCWFSCIIPEYSWHEQLSDLQPVVAKRTLKSNFIDIPATICNFEYLEGFFVE